MGGGKQCPRRVLHARYASWHGLSVPRPSLPPALVDLCRLSSCSPYAMGQLVFWVRQCRFSGPCPFR
eukprot:3247998-Pyramimonas_sp.AAC.1